MFMDLHHCADCPIRCTAMKKPRSLYARVHGWHKAWWPGWKIYQNELRGTVHRVPARAES